MLGEPGSGDYLPVIVCNDTREAARGQYRVTDAGGEEVIQGSFDLPANQTWQVGRIRSFASSQRLYLIDWQMESDHAQAAGKFGNHYLSGTPPFSFERYREWLAQIAALPREFQIS